MRFFLQDGGAGLDALKSLTDYEYFKTEPLPLDKQLAARTYKYQMDYGYFAAHFGWSIDQYEAITPVERLFILKNIESETVTQTELYQGIVELSLANSFRKKGRTYKKFWKKLKKKGDVPISYGEAKKWKAAFKAKFSKRKSQTTQ